MGLTNGGWLVRQLCAAHLLSGDSGLPCQQQAVHGLWSEPSDWIDDLRIKSQFRIGRPTGVFASEVYRKDPLSQCASCWGGWRWVDALEVMQVVRAEISRDGRVASITWTTTGDLAQVEGWVLVRTIDGSEETVEVSRDSATRSFEFPVTDLAATHRIEARAADGQVVTSSGSLTFTSDQ